MTEIVRFSVLFSTLLLTTSVWSVASSSAAFSQEPKDIVRYRDPKTGHEKKRTGEIVEYSGKVLIVKVPSGNEVTIPGEDVIDFETKWSDEHRHANQLFAARDFAAALLSYNQALVEKQPQWIVRRIMARRVMCLSALNKPAEAADSFFRIIDVDPDSQYFDSIPLNWEAMDVDRQLEGQCAKWLESTDAFKQLVAASWLLSTASRLAAIKTLEQLANHADARIALLATTQKWRPELVSVTGDDLQQWRTVIDRMPESLRAGPLFVLGSAMLKLNENLDESVLTLMRVPTLYPNQHQLAARCLFDSAVALKNVKRVEEADIMLRELIAKYAETGYAAEAQKMLE